MHRCWVLIILSIYSLGLSGPAGAAETAIEKVFPSPACADGWIMDGKVTLYDKDTLFDRINGEAELYMPYGFEVLAYARYADKKNPQIAIDADIYKMGSLLDAFGIFANYRRKSDESVKMGGDGTLSSSQMFFYQDRYLVRLQATGIANIEKNIFLACAEAISKNLPANNNKPKELDAFDIPSVVPKTERYIAQSVLGYEFFRKGITADAMTGKETVQVFIVLQDSEEGARKAFDLYRSYLKTEGKESILTGKALSSVDPLYGNVFLDLSGRYLVGAVRFNNAVSVRPIVEEMKKRIGK